MQEPAAVELEWNGSIWRGVVVGALGVLTRDDRSTYTGGVTGGMPDGRGVIKWYSGNTEYCELAAGKLHGYSEDHWANGTVGYWLYERGEVVHSACASADGNCSYDRKPCEADHAGLVALKAAVQQATVRAPPSPCSPSDRRRRGGFVRVVRVRVPLSAVAVSHW
jgi:hypothetical protein